MILSWWTDCANKNGDLCNNVIDVQVFNHAQYCECILKKQSSLSVSLLVCIQTAYGKTHQLQTKTLSALDEICLEVGKELISKLRQSVAISAFAFSLSSSLTFSSKAWALTVG